MDSGHQCSLKSAYEGRIQFLLREFFLDAVANASWTRIEEDLSISIGSVAKSQDSSFDLKVPRRSDRVCGRREMVKRRWRGVREIEVSKLLRACGGCLGDQRR